MSRRSSVVEYIAIHVYDTLSIILKLNFLRMFSVAKFSDIFLALSYPKKFNFSCLRWIWNSNKSTRAATTYKLARMTQKSNNFSSQALDIAYHASIFDCWSKKKARENQQIMWLGLSRDTRESVVLLTCNHQSMLIMSRKGDKSVKCR